MWKKEHKEFDTCPNCGSKKLLAKMAQQEAIERGLVKPGRKFFLYLFEGTPLDRADFERMLVGSRSPVVSAKIDMCTECGALVGREYDKGEAVKTLTRDIPNLPPQGMVR